MATKLEIEKLYEIIGKKIKNEDSDSYSYGLAKSNIEKITRKIGEESIEVVIAAFLNEQNPSKENKKDLTNEICDLIYHLLVLLVRENIKLEDLLKEFHNRNKS